MAASPIALVRQAEAASRVGDRERAERALQEVLETDDAYRPAHVAYGLLFEEFEDWAEARQAYLWALRLEERLEEWLALARVEAKLADDLACDWALKQATAHVDSELDALKVALGTLDCDRLDFARVFLKAAIRTFSTGPA